MTDLHVTFSGAQVVAFIGFMVIIGPGLIYMGRLTQRMAVLEKNAAKSEAQREEMIRSMTEIKTRIEDVWRQVRGRAAPPEP